MCDTEIKLEEECGWTIFAPPADFVWIEGQTPMASYSAIAVSEVLYFGVIYGLQWYMGPKPVGAAVGGDGRLFKMCMCAHNAILCLLSLAMFCGAGYEAWSRSQRDGVDWMFCERPGKKAVGGVYYWSYIYYLSKYLEFVDTVFKAIKRKPLDLLHVYHHSVVAFMCFNWLKYAQSLQTLGLMVNTIVHVFMYYYYALTVYYPPPWWKRFITKGQIIQFQSSFILALPFVYMYFTRKEGCAGAGSFLGNAAFNLSLLVLFLRFSRNTYTTKDKKE